ncbi:uncharacterized protein A1O9_00831 [Exophiala aquamarina CBS 119918]|uniref:Fungal N-terminal domain-containing protein n=1 Tax=Exophiala aquamarina CBS 119918 TaxID=1182545 RepID=A0A072PU50_9EURO|nr:uncharacterized protein A1O9_00831 [Exophiala aquamarina CBS 119918]KEF62858.1 hypothetical protein A1O9_00831 [Exophiala aquamarina CBS 119918]
MPIPFGFSVGDFLTVIDLTAKIVGALSDAGGASTEYQHALIEIEGFQRVINIVSKLSPTENNLEHALHGSIRKLRWTFYGSDDFKQFRRFIGMKVLCINMLLSTQLYQSDSKAQPTQRREDSYLLGEVIKIRQSMEQLELASVASQNNAGSAIEEALEPVKDQLNFIADGSKRKFDSISMDITSIGTSVS